jgi:class 3 adenylate cyclase
VHKAARIAALAEGGEILASLDTVTAEQGDFRVSESREVALRGVAGPVRITRVEWH